MLAWSWPKGWVANLVLGFAVTGILSLLLVYPIQQQEENRWIRIFSKWYYVALIPLVIMLLLAIGRRISEYGVTENRYFVLAMGLALAGIVLYFFFSPAQNLKIVPIVLCILAFFSAFGPWGAFRVSENSQAQRQDSLRLNYYPDAPGRILDLMGIDFVNPWQKDSSAAKDFNFTALWQNGIDIAGYDCLISNREFSTLNPRQEAVCSTGQFVLRLDASFLVLVPAAQPADSVRIALEPLLRNIMQEYGHEPSSVPAEAMTAAAVSKSLKAKVVLVMVQGGRDHGELTVSHVQADVLIGKTSEGR